MKQALDLIPLLIVILEIYNILKSNNDTDYYSDTDRSLTASTKYLPIMTIILTGFDFIIACGRCH